MGRHPVYAFIDGSLSRQDVLAGDWEPLGKDEAQAFWDRLSDTRERQAYGPGEIVLHFAFEVSQDRNALGRISEVSIAVDPELPGYCETLIDDALRVLRADAVKALAKTPGARAKAGAA